MSTDQNRQPTGVPIGGQFATRQLAETGTVLTALAPAPVWGVERRADLQAELAAANTTVRDAYRDSALLRQQRAAATAELQVATTAGQAREAGADIAELEFMVWTADLAYWLARDDASLALACVEVDEDAGRAITACMELRSGSDGAGYSAMLIRALDLESDLGAGHIGWHPWQSEDRAEAIRELNFSIEAMPESPEEPVWTERLLQFGDPFRLRRVALQARRSPTAANLALLDLAQVASRANDGLTNEH